jgi:hypothetical protein
MYRTNAVSFRTASAPAQVAERLAVDSYLRRQATNTRYTLDDDSLSSSGLRFTRRRVSLRFIYSFPLVPRVRTHIDFESSTTKRQTFFKTAAYMWHDLLGVKKSNLQYGQNDMLLTVL